MAAYLLKTEPDTYSFADLQRDKRTTWDGVSNAAALINLRDQKGRRHLHLPHRRRESDRRSRQGGEQRV
ncbi:MAG: EVE domain-containing protein [Phycisphaerales bacterium]